MTMKNLAFGGLCAALLVLSGCSCGDGGTPDPLDGELPDAGGGTDGEAADAPRSMRCGNLMMEGSEECDDGNTDPDDGCSADCMLECGDGRVSGDETCDVAIADGEPGACPADCDDGDSCTVDAIDGTECAPECAHAPITAIVSGDMCCPPGADSTTDTDCMSTCGDGIVSGTETCDTAIASTEAGACPTACDDGDACTTDGLANDGTCSAICEATPITAAADGDMCCPAGLTLADDSDCPAMCGDGVLSMGESCDTGIASGAGACPVTCDDGSVCTTDSVSMPGTCDAVCASAPITMPINGDGCCPPGATMATDTDCTGRCGDGIVQMGETCDTAIMSGAGRCPTAGMCNDAMACTSDRLVGGGTCSASCVNTPITMPMNGDGCCPSGATIATDSDCPRVCGDGVVTAPEACDTAIMSGAGSCPTMCNDMMACTRDTLTGSACSRRCTFTPITMPMGGDGCCPAGATIGTDSDCPARCGDMVITAPETCDDGNTMSGDGCSSMCRLEVVPTAYRFSDLDLREPHVYATVPLLGCRDLTDFMSPFGDGVNPLLQDNIQNDGDGDGLLDLSLAHVFMPLVQTTGTSTMSFLDFPDCTAPMSSTACTLPAGASRTMGTAMNMGGGATCLGVLPGTVRPYSPVVTPSIAPPGGTCYVVNAGTVTIDLSGIMIRLTDAYIGGEYFGSPATEIRDGLIRGFISVTDADATIIPAGTTGIASIDGAPLSRLLRGGAGNCSQPAPMMGDLDTGPGGVRGWYFYLNFRATRVTSYTVL